LRIEASLVNAPQRVQIGFLELSDSERHAAIVAGLQKERGAREKAAEKSSGKGSGESSGKD
jgi:hypothetical protein